MGPEPVVVETDAQFAVDGKSFASGVHAPACGRLSVPLTIVRTGSGWPVEIDRRKHCAIANAGKTDVLMGIEFVIDFSHPAESRRHYQVGSESIRIGQKETGAESRLVLFPGESIVKMSVVIATAGVGILVAPVAAVNLLFVREIMIDGKAPISLPGRKNPNLRIQVIPQLGQGGRRNQR